MIQTIAVIGAAIGLGIICGSGCVYAFNHIPDEWLGADEEGREWQRVKSVPWKYIFTATFIVAGIYIGLSDFEKAAGVYASCLLLCEIGMAAFLYDRIPRPLVWLLALTGVGILSFTIAEDLGFGPGMTGMLKAHLLGAAVGFAVMLLLVLLKCFISGGGLAKLKSSPWMMNVCELTLVLGLLCGWRRVLTIIACGLIAWGVYVVFKKHKKGGIMSQRISADGTLGKIGLSENFFITASGFVWMLAGAGLDITVI